MACGETSFNSYTFTFKWTVNDLETCLHNPSKLSSPTFSSPSGVKPATKWMLTICIFNGDATQTPPPPVGEQSPSVELRRLRVSTLESTTSLRTGNIRFSSGGLTLGGSGLQFGKLTLGQPTNTPLFQKHRDDNDDNDNDEDLWVETNILPCIVTGKGAVCLCISASQGPTKPRLCKPKASPSITFSFISDSESDGTNH